MVSRGIVYVVFGKNYERLAVETIAINRRFTDLPFCVFTNIQSYNREHGWKGIKNVTFKEFPSMPDHMNRSIKTQIAKITPYSQTIYLDVDMALQNKGIEHVFDYLNGNTDVVLNKYLRWEENDKILRIYKRAMKQFGCSLPLDVYNGAFIAFNKCQRVSEFFDLWHIYWIKFGMKREMPCLACAIQNMDALNVLTLPSDFFAVDTLKDRAIIQNSCNGFMEKFEIKADWQRYMKGDNPEDWKWVKPDKE